MNQINQSQTFEPLADGTETSRQDAPRPAADTAAPATPQPDADGEARILKPADVRALQVALVQGTDALARRKDLGDMYKRMIATITTLDSGLKESQQARADADRTLLSARLDGMETAINSVEGVLRIEMEPLLRSAVRDAVEDQVSLAGRRGAARSFGSRLLQLAALCACLYAGAAFSNQINDFADKAQGTIVSAAGSIWGLMSPDGGILNTGNHVD